MKASLISKLETARLRFDEISRLLALPEILRDQSKMRELGRERTQLQKIVKVFDRYCDNQKDLEGVEKMHRTSETEIKNLAQEEIIRLKRAAAEITEDIRLLLLPADPHNSKNIFLEIRAGTGGDEAAIFVGNLFRMYSRYALDNNWKIEMISASESEHGGYKEIISRIIGKGAYSRLKFESGTHRVQRIPETEAHGRIHTSTATVAILPEADEIDAVRINPSELRIDTFRASGAGGQHVNKTDSAIRITHLPSGIAVECQEDRSQHRNKSRATALLQARLLDIERQRQSNEQAKTRRNLVGSGDRSERIRTYNFPQGRVTDHRIALTLYQLSKLLEGNMDIIIAPLINEQQARQLIELDKED